MERDYYSQQGESVLLGAYYTSPSTPIRNSDVDFNDVFGGPPRRSSVNEMRHSLSLSRLQSQDLSGDEGGEGASCPWPPEGEKPVFGEDNGNHRRRHPNRSNDFFDDIFGGEESPRTRDRDPFSSRVLSPARPLPSPLESLASSLPSAFSLPAKLTKGMDLPTFGSSARSSNPLNSINNGIVTSNGSGSSDSHLSRFSPQATKQKEESKNDAKPSYRQSLLSKEFSDQSIPDKADKGGNMKQDQPISEASPGNSNGQFHFSIYKWASKGVPMAMPPRAERKDKFKLERCSNAKDWIVSDITTQNDSPIVHNASSLWNNQKQDESVTYTTIQNGVDSLQIVEQIASAKAQPDTLSILQTVTKDVPGKPISSDTRAESSTHSVSEIISLSGKTEAASKNQKLESKSLRFFLSDEKQDYDGMTRRERREERKTKSTKRPSAIFDVNVNPKTREEIKVPLKGVEHSKAASQDSLNLGKNMGKNQVNGKVKEFVRIFNQEAVAKPRVDSKSQGSAYKQREPLKTKNEVEGYPEQSKKENSKVESSNMSTNDLSPQDDIDISASAMPDISFTVIGDKDQSFHENFTIKVLAEDVNEDLQNQDNQEIQVIDNKIQRWSKGKEGNIRSLLSTLQYVLWPGCGWKPVPLVDIIEGNAVKRAYQRALLCLHPDKLQQKGAASHQKYIAEKVFDILQEAWSQFNLMGAL